MPPEQFSKRHSYRAPKEISVREDAPANLRYFVLQGAYDFRLSSGWLLKTICKLLRTVPYSDQNYDYQIEKEVEERFYSCEWFHIYDLIERIYATIAESEQYSGDWEDRAGRFAAGINEFFADEGIGWQLKDGQILTRGPEAFEAVVTEAAGALEASRRPTAAKHVHEALQDLSRRPDADLPGAVYHAMGALECIARDVTDDEKATLGEILKRNPGLLPKPLDSAVSQVWGYASNEARHVQEGREISRDEAELVVGLVAALSTYLTRKHQ
jgi:hypothetical protein